VRLDFTVSRKTQWKNLPKDNWSSLCTSSRKRWTEQVHAYNMNNHGWLCGRPCGQLQHADDHKPRNHARPTANAAKSLVSSCDQNLAPGTQVMDWFIMTAHICCERPGHREPVVCNCTKARRDMTLGLGKLWAHRVIMRLCQASMSLRIKCKKVKMTCVAAQRAHGANDSTTGKGILIERTD